MCACSYCVLAEFNINNSIINWTSWLPPQPRFPNKTHRSKHQIATHTERQINRSHSSDPHPQDSAAVDHGKSKPPYASCCSVVQIACFLLSSFGTVAVDARGRLCTYLSAFVDRHTMLLALADGVNTQHGMVVHLRQAPCLPRPPSYMGILGRQGPLILSHGLIRSAIQ